MIAFLDLLQDLLQLLLSQRMDFLGLMKQVIHIDPQVIDKNELLALGYQRDLLSHLLCHSFFAHGAAFLLMEARELILDAHS